MAQRIKSLLKGQDKEISPTLLSKETDLKLGALANDLRRLLLAMIYEYGMMYQSDIQKHIQIDSNRLAYHLNILRAANLVERKLDRQGRTLSKYSVKEGAEKFLEFIGAKDELDKLGEKSS